METNKQKQTAEMTISQVHSTLPLEGGVRRGSDSRADAFYSPHFSFEEMTGSRTAVKHGLTNEPDEAQIDNLQALCSHLLEPLRARWREPIIVTSGFRSPEVNRLVGGVPNSQHLEGKAADIRALNPKDTMELGGYLEHSLIPFDQLIYEGVSKDGKRCRWLHVSWSEKPRKQVLRK